MREIGRIEDGYAVDLHDRVAILDDLQVLVVDGRAATICHTGGRLGSLRHSSHGE